MSDDNINAYVPSLFNPRSVRKHNGDISLTQNSFVSRSSLSLSRKNIYRVKTLTKVNTLNKENSQNVRNLITATNLPRCKKIIDKDSLGFSAIEDLHNGRNLDIGSLGECDIHSIYRELHDRRQSNNDNLVHDKVHHNCQIGDALVQPDCEIIEDNNPLISVSSNTELDNCFDSKSDSTVIYNVDQNIKPLITVSFGINKCQNLNINSKKSNIKSVQFLQKDDNILVDCEIVESSKISYESEPDENMNEPQTPNSLKRSSVTVNLEVKKKKLSPETADNSRILILNTSAVEKISHIIVQPPNYKLVKKTVLNRTKVKSIVTRKPVSSFNVNNGAVDRRLRQKSIDSFFCKPSKVLEGRSLVGSELVKVGVNNNDDKEAMSRKSVLVEKSPKSQFLGRLSENAASNRQSQPSPRTTRSTPRCKNDSPCSFSSRHNVDSIQFPIQNNVLTKKLSPATKPIPHYKIVSGTHFAVDAFSYGNIQNVSYYFLTHFHSDHYSGLKKSFNKVLFCSKITADLCISRLGVNPKCIHVIKIDETVRIDGVEVTAVEANHCPGAIMLVFTLANGKTLLHTGDFRASPAMESYPIFWNKDIHTIYLDTTYCNPRYDFPTQEQSLEMALYILRQKKLALEKVGKKFSSVLIVCGTYTIGKEKFFLGMARRVGCSVWACPEKDRVLQAVEGRSFGQAPPQSCQLHVVPMKDLTHDKLRAYLESLKGAFSEVVAFKPSGWENGKNATSKKDMVTIHGIPYSEHSSFSELIRFVKFLKPKQVVPTVDISGGIKAVQKYFQCPLVCKEETASQTKLTDFFSIQNEQKVPAVT